MAQNNQNTDTKTNKSDWGYLANLKTGKYGLNRNHFSRPHFMLFIAVFAVIGFLLVRTFAAAPLVATLEAEQMSQPAGTLVITDAAASSGKAIKLSTNGISTGSVNFSSSVTSFTVIARGDQCQGAPAMTAALDGTNYLTNTPVSSNTWSSYSVTLGSPLNSGAHSLSIAFTNDYTKYKGHSATVQCSRNLYLDVTNFYGPSTTTSAPTVTLSASPTSVASGQSATLTWNSTNASSCSASGAWSGSEPTSGSASTGALNQSSAYSLTCTGSGGSASASATVSVSAPTTDINVLTQYGTTDSAIRAAISAAQSQGRGLYFPAATYNYSSYLVLNGVKAHGDGVTSVFVAAAKSSMAIELAGNGAELRSVKVTCPQCELPSGPPTSARLSNGESAGVFIQPSATNFVVDHVTVERAGSAGILNWGGSYGKITYNTVNNTLADGIHNTNGANNIEVAYNTENNVGDDMFAVVSYLSDGKISHDISVHDNTGNGQPWGRGATVVGGSNVQIYNNSINHTYGAGIYVVAEGGTYNTYGDSNITVNNNTIRYPDQGNIHNCNIMIGTYNTTQTTTNVTGSGNNLDRAKPGLSQIGNYSGVSVGWSYGN